MRLRLQDGAFASRLRDLASTRTLVFSWQNTTKTSAGRYPRTARSAAAGAFALFDTASKSPRKAFSAWRSSSISKLVRKPSRRSSGTGGHQPSTAC